MSLDNWDDEQEIEDSEDFGYKPIKSASEYLRSSFGTNQIVSKRNADKTVLTDVLWELNKTSNLIQNSLSSEEQKMKVYFSDGHKVNVFGNNTIYVSSSMLKDSATGKLYESNSNEFYDSVDALNGKVLLCSFMEKRVSKDTAWEFDIAKWSLTEGFRGSEWSIRNIFITDLHNDSLKEIKDEWPGFKSYIDAMKQKCYKKKEEVLNFMVRGNGPSLDDFVDMLCYNVLNDDKIIFDEFISDKELSDGLNEVQEFLNKKINEEIDNKERLNRSVQIYSHIKNVLSRLADSKKQEKNDRDTSDNNGNRQNSNHGKGNIPSIRDFSGDNSFSKNECIEGDDFSGKIIPDQNSKYIAKSSKSESLTTMAHDIFNHVTFKRISPSVESFFNESYQNLVLSHRFLINGLKNSFSFYNTELSYPNYGLPSGHLDENSLHKIHLNDYQHLYRRNEIPQRKKWLVSLLMDQSGSMSTCARYVHARELAIVFAEAIKSLKDIEVSIYGFSSSGDNISTFVYKDRNTDRLESLVDARPHCETALGFSVGHVADSMLVQYPEYENKILFILTDGEPTAAGSHMTPIQHTKMACDMARSKNIKVFGIGICNAFDEMTGCELFGDGNFVVIDNVSSSLNVLTNALTKFMKRLK